jgi:oligoendopeptidase F
MQRYKTRADVPTEYTWDLASIFARDEDWEHSFQAIQATLPVLQALKGTLAQSGQALLTVLQKGDEVSEKLERLYAYASMRRDENTTNGTYQGMVERAMRLYVFASTAISYIEPEILALPQQTLDQFIQETPGLALYKHLLDNLNRKRSHIRTAEVEDILAAVSEITAAPGSIYSTLSNADLKFPYIGNEVGEQVKLTQGNYLAYIRSPDRHIRKEAFEAVHSTLLAQRNTFASTLSAQVKTHLFYAQQRNYNTCCEQALAKYNIPISVYDTLIKTANEQIPLLVCYLQLRKRMLKVDELHMYDFYAPLVEETNSSISYQQACETIMQALAPLGDTYRNILHKAFSQRWIDVYETPAKPGGAYTNGVYGTHPFTLMNWQDDLKSMYTLAHELGHCLHSYFTHSHQPYQYGNYTPFIAEVASTLNEGLLTDYLLKHTTDRATRLAILNQSLEEMRNKFFRQALSAEFELQIHSIAEAGEPLTANTLETMYGTLNKKYYSAGAVVDELITSEWARIPHFYYNFYVYQYATGISAASSLVQQILYEGRPAIKRYLNFLSSGSSDYSIELLKKAGVDITTSLPVYQALQVFKSHLSQMEVLHDERRQL